MNNQLFEHLKIWGTLGATQLAANAMSLHELVSIFTLLCGAFSSLAIAWCHIKKK
jgi:hypothetical protein